MSAVVWSAVVALVVFIHFVESRNVTFSSFISAIEIHAVYRRAVRVESVRGWMVNHSIHLPMRALMLLASALFLIDGPAIAWILPIVDFHASHLVIKVVRRHVSVVRVLRTYVISSRLRFSGRREVPLFVFHFVWVGALSSMFAGDIMGIWGWAQLILHTALWDSLWSC